ncbi:hypothetical protein IE81DRAFT_320912 [Ceraceosorus guamensis]|uniref:Uncharacterized protein n=1 Tax=Ceraceosorus guamensis TaxID=1522189 RepID=A0A316W4V9_9BASI|nr:hypothetical protein IE81DRAFT_320912 [Ceraceosorus guamensis]PWN44930.1 hypothetical protein IE81DRAFT_320912 [Ceraceosorus guamensis]
MAKDAATARRARAARSSRNDLVNSSTTSQRRSKAVQAASKRSVAAPSSSSESELSYDSRDNEDDYGQSCSEASASPFIASSPLITRTAKLRPARTQESERVTQSSPTTYASSFRQPSAPVRRGYGKGMTTGIRRFRALGASVGSDFGLPSRVWDPSPEREVAPTTQGHDDSDSSEIDEPAAMGSAGQAPSGETSGVLLNDDDENERAVEWTRSSESPSEVHAHSPFSESSRGSPSIFDSASRIALGSESALTPCTSPPLNDTAGTDISKLPAKVLGRLSPSTLRLLRAAADGKDVTSLDDEELIIEEALAPWSYNSDRQQPPNSSPSFVSRRTAARVPRSLRESGAAGPPGQTFNDGSSSSSSSTSCALLNRGLQGSITPPSQRSLPALPARPASAMKPTPKSDYSSGREPFVRLDLTAERLPAKEAIRFSAPKSTSGGIGADEDDDEPSPFGASEHASIRTAPVASGRREVSKPSKATRSSRGRTLKRTEPASPVPLSLRVAEKKQAISASQLARSGRASEARNVSSSPSSARQHQSKHVNKTYSLSTRLGLPKKSFYARNKREETSPTPEGRVPDLQYSRVPVSSKVR